MLFKQDELKHELAATTIFLQDMAENLDRFVRLSTGMEIMITRVVEHICGDSGVHEANRAFDVRDEFDGQRTFSDEEIEKILNFMNQAYPRNDGHKTAIHHSFNGGPYHLHIQIALNVNTYVLPTDKLKP